MKIKRGTAGHRGNSYGRIISLTHRHYGSCCPWVAELRWLLCHTGQQESLREDGPQPRCSHGQTWEERRKPGLCLCTIASGHAYSRLYMCVVVYDVPLRTAVSMSSSSGRAMDRLWRRRSGDIASWLRSTVGWFSPSPASWIRYTACFE